MHHWSTAPQPIRSQVEQVATGLLALLDGDLVGIYLHGSLAMGCFHPSASDIDLLVITRRPIHLDVRAGLVRLFLALSGSPAPLELSLLCQADLQPWRFPTPFQLHFSEGWRERFSQGLAAGRLPPQPEADPDLAAHITILHHRGIVLHGAPIARLLPPVPPGDYLAAIWEHDTRQPGEWVRERPVYYLLNLCRVLAYVSEGRVTSKAEGGAWALTALPAEHRSVVVQALALYRGEEAEASFDPAAVSRFGAYMAAVIDAEIRGM